jgi:hypothetical protein
MYGIGCSVSYEYGVSPAPDAIFMRVFEIGSYDGCVPAICTCLDRATENQLSVVSCPGFDLSNVCDGLLSSA